LNERGRAEYMERKRRRKGRRKEDVSEGREVK
jgi:hypothetical protein